MDRGLGTEVIVEDSQRVMRIDGQMRHQPEVVVSKEKFEEYRLGRRCLRCHGLQSREMPEVCETKDVTGGNWRCGFRIRDDQLRYLQQEDGGEQHYGPTPDDYDYEQEAWTPRKDSRIWVPNTRSKN